MIHDAVRQLVGVKVETLAGIIESEHHASGTAQLLSGLTVGSRV